MSPTYPQNIPLLCQIIATLNSYFNKQKSKEPCNVIDFVRLVPIKHYSYGLKFHSSHAHIFKTLQ